MRVYNSATSSGKLIGLRSFLTKALGTIVDRRPEERPRKIEAMP